MDKIKQQEQLKIILKEQLNGFLQLANTFSFMSSAKGAPAYWKKFLYDVLTSYG